MKLRLGVEPGLETRDPMAAGDRYVEALQSRGMNVAGKRIMILGYGGYFGLAVNLLERGTDHVVLFDPFARVNHEMNLHLAQGGSPFLSIHNDRVVPNQGCITIIPDLEMGCALDEHPPIDFIKCIISRKCQ